MGGRDGTTKTSGKQDGGRRVSRRTLLAGAGASLVVGAFGGTYAWRTVGRPDGRPTGIDARAPVVSRHGAVIGAPAETLWRLHSDVEAWPDWHPDIDSVSLDGPFAPGSVFSWSQRGLTIDSTIYRVEPGRHVLWGGPLLGIFGVHSWTFTPVEGGTRVDTDESWDGVPVVAADLVGQEGRLQGFLDGSLEDWLGHLERAARRE